MDLDEESAEINNVFDQLSQAQSSASQRPSASATPPIPQSNVGNRRNRRDETKKGGKKMAAAVEPGFGNTANEPVNISKKKNLILGGLRDILANHKKALPSKKDAFNSNPLEDIGEVMDFLELNDNGELVKMSSMLYALRVDTTYNDANATLCQLQPNRLKPGEDASKKLKAEQKATMSTASQSLNLQKLQREMEQDAPEDEHNDNGMDGFDMPDYDPPDMEGPEEPPVIISDETDHGNEDGGDGGGPEADMGGDIGGGMGGDEDGGGGGGEDDGEGPPPEDAPEAVEGGGDDEIQIMSGDEGEERQEMNEEGEDMDGLGVMPAVEKEAEEMDRREWMMDSDDEEEYNRRLEADWKDEQKQKILDKNPVDTARMTWSEKVIDEYIEREEKRRDRNLLRKMDLNPMLMDGEKQARIMPSDILTNEYYQIATSHYKDLNASGMLAYNAKVTHNGRMTLMHKHMDKWVDRYANDCHPPSIEFRRAIAGLVDNAMVQQPVYINLFDAKDKPTPSGLLTTGLQLLELEKKTREQILTDTGDFDFLDKDDHIEDDEPPRPPSRKGSLANGEDAGPSSVSNSAAETENSDGTTPKSAKDKENGTEKEKDENEIFMEDVEGADNKKPRRRNLVAALYTDDTIPNGPVLSTDDLASKFQQILFDKVSKEGSKPEWKFGSHAEELQLDIHNIENETIPMRNFHAVTDMMHLDKIWTSKYYKRKFTNDEAVKIKATMLNEMSRQDYDKMAIHFKQGVYEFIGHDDKWTNPVIVEDDCVDFVEDQPLVRELEDEREKRIHKKVMAVEEGEEVEDEDEIEPDDRICVEPETASAWDAGNDHNDDLMDDNDNGLFSDDDAAPMSSRRTDFTEGDDRREGEASEISGVTNPTIDADLPSAAVRGAGKADDSHWKGGKAEPVKPKKERKKKMKEDDEHRIARYFDVTDKEDMLNTWAKKIPNRFQQILRSVDLMKETDQLLMPVQIDVVPQINYNIQNFYCPFLLPGKTHSQYVVRDNEDVEDGVPSSGRLDHYTSLLDSSMDEGIDREDVFLSFLRTFRHFPEVATHKEIEVESKVKSGEIQPDEAAVEMGAHFDEDMDGPGGGAYDDDGDFGGGDDDYGGMEIDAEEEARRARDGDIDQPVLPVFVHNQERREQSQARSVAEASSHGYGMRVGKTADGKDDEGDAVATIGNREYQLRLIKLDTVAMKTALSDVLTNPLMNAETLDETLGHFHRALPTQKLEDMRRRQKKNLQTIAEDEEWDELDLSGPINASVDDSQERADIEATMMEVPDALNVTRALFAPPKEKAKPAKPMTFGEAAGASTSQQANKSQEHIELQGHHTLKSTFTILPARMPLSSTSDVTVASTIAMILHLANENNLILNQEGQDMEGIDEAGNTAITTSHNWMTDFEVRLEDDDAQGSKMAKVAKRISKGMEVLQQLSADEDASDAEKRQRETDKMLVEMAAKQRAEREEEDKRREEEERKRKEEEEKDEISRDKAEERRRIKVERGMEEERRKAAEMRKARNGGVDPLEKKKKMMMKKKDTPGPSSAVVDLSSDATSDEDDIIAVPVTGGSAFKKPAAPSSSRRGTHRSAEDDDESAPGPSTKRPRRSSGAANTTVDLEDTILIDD